MFLFVCPSWSLPGFALLASSKTWYVTFHCILSWMSAHVRPCFSRLAASAGTSFLIASSRSLFLRAISLNSKPSLLSNGIATYVTSAQMSTTPIMAMSGLNTKYTAGATNFLGVFQQSSAVHLAKANIIATYQSLKTWETWEMWVFLKIGTPMYTPKRIQWFIISRPIVDLNIQP